MSGLSPSQHSLLDRLYPDTARPIIGSQQHAKLFPRLRHARRRGDLLRPWRHTPKAP